MMWLHTQDARPEMLEPLLPLEAHGAYDGPSGLPISPTIFSGTSSIRRTPSSIFTMRSGYEKDVVFFLSRAC